MHSTPITQPSQAQLDLEWKKFELEQARLERKEREEIEVKKVELELKREEQARLEREKQEELAMHREIE
ncbi:hypothetical protein, partial [Klebsiella pneumoniae]|uniref:hypothetical protein n=1 Tax=Klebsiella pneumoniae TaxID=573 RepID=UPI003EC0D764